MNKREILTKILSGEISREQLTAPASSMGHVNADGTVRTSTLLGQKNFTPEALAGHALPFIFVVDDIKQAANLPERRPERVLITPDDLESDPLD